MLPNTESREQKTNSKEQIVNNRGQTAERKARKLCYLLIAACLLNACHNPYMYRDLETLYWNREANFFTVIFNSMGGSDVPSQSIPKNSKITKPQDPVMESGVFSAWYKNTAYTALWDFDNDTVTEDITLYAKWEIDLQPVIHTVTFDSNGGTSHANPSIITIEHNGFIEPPLTKPTRTDYVFFSWYKEPECINEWNFAVDTVTEDITLYARWVQNVVIVTLGIEQIMNGDPIVDSVTISRTASGGYSNSAVVSVNISDYDPGSIIWEISGVGAYSGQTITGTGSSFTLDAANDWYNTTGGHTLRLEVKKDGVTYQVNIHFTIRE